MSVAANKQVARRMGELYRSRDLAVIDEIFAPDFRGHFGEGVRGPEGVREVVSMFLTGFPDLHYSIDDLLGEGDKVVLRWSMRGTQRGVFMGFPASGRHAAWSGITIQRFANGKIVEAWPQMDLLRLMKLLTGGAG